MVKEIVKKLVIVGSGPAGYTAAIYAARAKLEPLMIEGFSAGGIPGGQLMTTTEVENFPGFPEGITGPELMESMKTQALRFGTEFLEEDVERVQFDRHPFILETKRYRVIADSVIIATGATAKRLDIEGTRDGELWQKGVTACAVCDGANPIFRNQPLFVIGGGDSAMEEALFLTHFASKVYLVHRRDSFRASKIMADRVLHHDKIEVLWNSAVEKVTGEKVVQEVLVKNLLTNEVTSYKAAGLFFAVGHVPNTNFLSGTLALHDNGYIKTHPGTTQTSIAGVFAAGDVQDWVSLENPLWISTLKKSAASYSPEPLRARALFALAKRGLLAQKKIHYYESHPSYYFQGIGILGALMKPYEDPAVAASRKSEALMELHRFLESEEDGKIALAIEIMAAADEIDPKALLKILKSGHPLLEEAACKALYHLPAKAKSIQASDLIGVFNQVSSKHRHYLLHMIERHLEPNDIPLFLSQGVRGLKNQQHQMKLALCYLGKAALPKLLEIFQSMDNPIGERLLSAKALREIAPEQFSAQLGCILDQEISRASELKQYLEKIHSTSYLSHPLPLKDMANASLDNMIDFVLQLLALEGSIQEADLFSHNLKSKHLKVRAQTIEGIERICPSHLFNRLKPLLNYQMDLSVKTSEHLSEHLLENEWQEILEKLSSLIPWESDFFITKPSLVKMEHHGHLLPAR